MNITIGQYYPAGSIIHRLDVRVKIILLIINIIFIFCSFSIYSILLMTAMILFIMVISKVPIKQYLRSMKAIIIIFIFTAVINVFYGAGETLWSFGFIKITYDGVLNAIFIALRLLDLIFISSVLTYSTTPANITDGLERVLSFLKIFKVNTQELSMMMSIAIRFIPTIMEETHKIIDAQKSRGADFESGNILNRIKGIIPIIIPLFMSSIKRATDLSVAMECRCYNSYTKKSKMKILRIKLCDIIAILFVVTICIGVIFCNIMF